MSLLQWLPPGLRPRLVLLILFTVSGSMLLMLGNAVHQRREALNSASSEAVLLSRLAAAHEERAVDVTRQIVHGLTRHDALRDRNPRATQRLLASLRDRNALIAQLSAMTPEGRIFASTLPGEIGMDVSATPWFAHVRTVRDLSTCEFAADTAAGRSALRCSEAVFDSTGRVRALLTATLDLEWLRRAASRARLPQQTVFLVVDQLGRVVARHPVGVADRTDSSVSAFHPGRSEWTQVVRGGDGRLRIVAFSPLEGARAQTLYVGVGIDRAAVLADANRSFGGTLALMVLLAALVSLVAWRGASVIVLRRIDALLEATTRLRHGDLAARTGLPYGRGELSELSRALDDMAAELQHQNEVRAQAEERLRQSEARKTAVLQSSLDAILVVDPGGAVVECNAAARRLFGGADLACMDHTLQDLLAGHETFDPSRPNRASGVFETLAHGVEGREFPAEVSIAPIRDRAARGLHVVIVRDITERRRAQKSLERMTFVDDLTGLYNRRGLLMFGQQQLKLAARSAQKVVLVSADLDGLKLINDSHGHAEGDRAILEFAELLRQGFRESDILARPGGDEFVVLATETEHEGADQAIERLMAALARRNGGGGSPWRLSASLGWKRFDPRQTQDLGELLAAADARMYEQKRANGAVRGTLAVTTALSEAREAREAAREVGGRALSPGRASAGPLQPKGKRAA